VHQGGTAAVVVLIAGRQVSTAGRGHPSAGLAFFGVVAGSRGLDVHQLGTAAVMGLLTIAGSQVSTTAAVGPIVGKQVSTAAVGPIVGKQDLDEG
jgi:hypothetical protein